MKKLEIENTFEKHSKDVTCLDVDQLNDLAFTGALDGTLRVWDLKTLSQVKVKGFGRKSVDFLAWNQQWKMVLVVLTQQNCSDLTLFDGNLENKIGEVLGVDKVVDFKMACNESSFLVKTKHGKFILFSIPDLTALNTFMIDDFVSLVTFFQDSILYFCRDFLKLRETKSKNLKTCLKVEVSKNSVISASEVLIVWSCFDVIYYTTYELNQVQSLHLHNSPIISLSTSHSKFSSLSSDCNLVVWDIESQKTLWSKSLTSPSSKLKLLKNSSIFLADIYRTVKIVNQNSSNDFPGHDFEVTCEFQCPEKNLIITGSRDCSLQVWERDSGRHLTTFKGHELFITTVTLTRSKRFLVSGSQDASIAVWDLEKKCLKHFFRLFEKPVSFLVSLQRSERVLAFDLFPSVFLLNVENLKIWKVSSDFNQPLRYLKLIYMEKYCICFTRSFFWVFKIVNL
jgi:WD40 repeat protein